MFTGDGSGGAGSSRGLEVRGPMMVANDYPPVTMSVKAFQKDLHVIGDFADDVQCGHGATCGRLDRDQLFYLMARGLPRGKDECWTILAAKPDAAIPWKYRSRPKS